MIISLTKHLRWRKDDHFGLGMAHDYFSDNSFKREEIEMDDDDISQGSEGMDNGGGYESDESESKEESPHVNTSVQEEAPQGQQHHRA